MMKKYDRQTVARKQKLFEFYNGKKERLVLEKASVIYSTKFVLKTFFQHARLYTAVLIVNTILQRISYVLLLQYSLLTIIDNIEKGTSFSGVLGIIIAFLILSIIVAFVDAFLSQYYTPKVYEKLSCVLQIQMFQSIKQVEMYHFDEPEFYEKYSRAMQNTDGKVFEMFNNMISIVANLTSVVALLSLFLTLSPLALIFIIIPFAFSIINDNKASKLDYELSKQTTNNSRKQEYVNKIFFDPAYINEIKVHRVNKLLFNMLHDAFEKSKEIYNNTYKKRMLHKKTIPFIIDFVIGNILYISLLLYQVITLGTLSIGGFSALFFASDTFTWNLSSLRRSMINHVDLSRYINEIIDFINMKTPKSSNPTSKISRGDIQIRDLSFAYIGNENNTINGLNLIIPVGKKAAIVGANGAGKTTFIKLLLGLYTPQHGKIVLGHDQIQNIDRNTYTTMFGTVFQDYNIYALSLLENIIMDEAYENDYVRLHKDILQVLGKSGLGIEDKLVNGLKTRLLREFSQDDIKLSIGQEQKIAISRVLYSDRQYIILDEPSSPLDPEAEYDFNNTIATYANGKTIIMISHRLSTTRNADIIFVFDNGKVVESGTHDSLMALDGLYCRMFNTQASKYTD